MLEQVIVTPLLQQRASRTPDFEAEARAMKLLARHIAQGSGTILQQLSEVALDLCRADSAGVSLLETDGTQVCFRWRGLAGAWGPYFNGGLPRNASPCGIVLDTNKTLLVERPGRHFPEVAKAEPELVEGLLAPFRVLGETVGTVWVLSHREERHFDREDQRIVESLAEFAGAAYLMLDSLARAYEDTVELKRSNLRLRESNDRLWRQLAALELQKS